MYFLHEKSVSHEDREGNHETNFHAGGLRFLIKLRGLRSEAPHHRAGLAGHLPVTDRPVVVLLRMTVNADPGHPYRQ